MNEYLDTVAEAINGGYAQMPPKKEHQQGHRIQPKEVSIEERLQPIGANDLRRLVKHLANESPQGRRLILEWLRKHSSGVNASEKASDLDDELLSEYWENAEGIISEFNQYGGGPEDAEEEAYDWLGRIRQLAEEGHISTEAKLNFMDEAFVQYNVGNSGFGDELADLFFEICDTPDEWSHLVGKLKERPSHWRNTLVTRIYKEYLHDNDAYLKERLSDLRYGLDYWDLAQFHLQQGDSQRAVETAEQGILKGEGRLTELFDFLLQHFASKKESSELERIACTAQDRHTDEKAVLDRLFSYYQGQADYEKAKDALLRNFNFAGKGNHYAAYKKIKAFLINRDWDDVEPKLFLAIKESDFHGYLRICLDKNMKETVLHAFQSSLGNPWGLLTHQDLDEFAEALREDFPDQIIEYHWNMASQSIRGANRKSYRTAAEHLKKAKQIYLVRLKDEPRWKQRFTELKAEFRRSPAFLEEVKNL